MLGSVGVFAGTAMVIDVGLPAKVSTRVPPEAPPGAVAVMSTCVAGFPGWMERRPGVPGSKKAMDVFVLAQAAIEVMSAVAPPG